jgi:cellulose synthase/poly-beta-1,6-N-acetylglucosamine synthase-like glycosyltransferase
MVIRNEEQILAGKLENLLRLDYPNYEIVVVSDGSSDASDSILRQFQQDTRLRIILKETSRGKAAGINDALGAVRGDVVVFTDARQRIEPGAVRLLMENFADPDVGCVSGELMLGDPESGEAGQGLGMYWRIEKRIRMLEAASASMVGATGAIYAVRRALLRPLPEGTILDDVYQPMEVVRQGKRVVFDERARAWDSPNLGTDREFKRKVRTLNGNCQLVQLAPWLLTRSNPLRFEFVSHKIMRLVVPFALAALLCASLFLTEAFYRVALILQLLFYSLSIWALSRPGKADVVSRFADASGTFVLLNTAAVVALANFVFGRRTVWTR